MVASDLKGSAFAAALLHWMKENLCKAELQRANCDNSLSLPAPWDEAAAPSQALQSHGGGRVGGEKEKE